MKPPAIRRFRRSSPSRRQERGITMVLVAIAMVAIIAMAALSIDVVSLYPAKEEAQRSADAAALGAARVLSLSGVTGDPQNTTGYWPAACTAATQVAQALANQNAVSNAAATSVNVNFLYNRTNDIDEVGQIRFPLQLQQMPRPSRHLSTQGTIRLG